MTKAQLFAAVGDIGDDLVARAADTARLADMYAKRKKSRRRTAAIIAACLLVAFVGAIYVQIDLNYFVASCGGSPGTLVNGIYYYRDINSGLYAYDPATGKFDLLISELFNSFDFVNINTYGIYYVGANDHDIKLRIHETGKTVTLYRETSDDYSHTSIEALDENTVTCILHSGDARYRTVLVLDALTGEILDTPIDHLPYDEGDMSIPYPVGDRNIARYTHQLGSSYLTEDGEPLLIDGEPVYHGTPYGSDYAGESLIARYNKNGTHYLLLRPSGENLLLPPDFEVYGGTNDYLFGRLPSPISIHNRPLHAYEIATGRFFALIPSYDMQEIITDGTHLYTAAPWASHTDVYRLDYTPDGTLTGATRIDTIGD